MALLERFKSGWNAFINNKDPTYFYPGVIGGTSTRPDRQRYTGRNDRSIATAMLTRIALDCANTDIKHVKLDENFRFKEEVEDDLNYCFNTEANIDQTGLDFKTDIYISLLDEGVVAVVPIETDKDPKSGDCKYFSLRTGKIVEWYPAYIKVNVYNDRIGIRQDLIFPKREVAIIENPLYPIINEPNSNMQRLLRKYKMLDELDEQSVSGKLDIIIQLPYVIKSEGRQKQAEKRRKDIEMQLSGSKYGIAYTDGTEKITQLNRSVENNLLPQIESLTKTLQSQLGLTDEILNGSATPEAMTNYYNRTVDTLVSAVVAEINRKFLTRAQRTSADRHKIMAFRDPFKIISVTQIANLADSLTRNEILSSNEVRQIIGLKPSSDPRADELLNKNVNTVDKTNSAEKKESVVNEKL